MPDLIERERRVSYGIGGMGNIRRPSEFPLKEEKITKIVDPVTGEVKERRRSSVWSIGSGGGGERKGLGFMKMFGGRSGKDEGAAVGEKQEGGNEEEEAVTT